jgi:hypothetical protein
VGWVLELEGAVVYAIFGWSGGWLTGLGWKRKVDRFVGEAMMGKVILITLYDQTALGMGRFWYRGCKMQ